MLQRALLLKALNTILASIRVSDVPFMEKNLTVVTWFLFEKEQKQPGLSKVLLHFYMPVSTSMEKDSISKAE